MEFPSLATVFVDVAPAITPTRNRRRTKNRILKTFVGVRPGHEHRGRREWTLHATKGWRSRRV